MALRRSSKADSKKKQMQRGQRYASELLIFARFNNLVVTFFWLQQCSRAFSRTP
jgi:hypothetical protein